MQRKDIKAIGWAAMGSIAILVFGALSFKHHVDLGATGPLYLLLILLVAWRAGFRASVPVILCATLGLDFFNTEPRLTLRMASSSDVFSVVSFACVAFLVSHLSHRIHLQSEQTKRDEQKQRSLYELARSAVLIDWKADIHARLCELIQHQCRLSAVALWDEHEKRFCFSGDGASMQEGVQASYRAERDYDIASRAEHIRMLRFGVRLVGAIAFRGEMDALMADAIASLVATNLERVRALNAEVSAESQAMSEQLRTAVLDGLAHAVKTPLATILLSASSLREVGTLTALQQDLAESIEAQSAYLADLATELLRTAAMDVSVVALRPETFDLTAMMDSVLVDLRPCQDVNRVHVESLAGKILIDADARLLRMAVAQVLENALKYSPSGSDVYVQLLCEGSDTSIAVHNEGTFIPCDERARVFERYYRSPSMEHRAPGTGVGLSVTLRAMEVHGGHVHVDSSPEAGTTFILTLPRKEESA